MSTLMLIMYVYVSAYYMLLRLINEPRVVSTGELNLRAVITCNA
jgi:hypothetical protein